VRTVTGEPFALVMAKAITCGTPVTALRRDAAPGIVVSGRTGIIVDHPSELADTIKEARVLDPTAVA
jgi:glycosyltransferase involved in cell wall biosynthesis